MITVYKIINLKTNHVYADDYLLQEDAAYAMSLLDHPHIHEMYADERTKLCAQTVSLQSTRNRYKNDRLTVHQPQRMGAMLFGKISQQRVFKDVVYDHVSKIWRVLEEEVAAA